MAVTKIKPIKSTLTQALDYICNPAETDEKILISSFGCSYDTADIEFGFTLSQAMNKGNNLAHHLIQSFNIGETTPEQAPGNIGGAYIFTIAYGVSSPPLAPQLCASGPYRCILLPELPRR